MRTYTIDKNGMVEDIAYHPTPNKGGQIEPSLIVVHDTAGDLSDAGAISWLSNPISRASAHFVISREGRITQLASCNVKTWHAGASFYKGRQGCNSFSIGIEHVNPGKMLAGGLSAYGKTYSIPEYGIRRIVTPHHGDGHWMPYTEEQLGASLGLCLAIRERYGITDVAPHWEISPGRKVDTNPLFPLASVRGRLTGRGDEDFILQSLPSAIFRQWPSFNRGNRITALDDDGFFAPLSSGVFDVSGQLDEMPEEIAKATEPSAQLWYKVTLEQADKEPVPAWVWSGHVKETRP